MNIFGWLKKLFGGLLGGGKRVEKPRKPLPPPKKPPTTLPTYDQPKPEEPVHEVTDKESFVFFGEWMRGFTSSNVTAMQYDYQDKTLTVQYHGGPDPGRQAFYEYYEIDETLAASAWDFNSRGKWVWNNLRIRGTKCGHQKSYRFLPALSNWRAKNPCYIPLSRRKKPRKKK